MEMNDIPVETPIDINANHNDEDETSPKVKEPDPKNSDQLSHHKLLPFNLEIDRFKNKYFRRSIHSIICISFFIVVVVINYFGIELFFSLFVTTDPKKPEFEIRPKMGESSLIVINNNNWEQLSQEVKQYLSDQKVVCESNDKFFCLITNELKDSQCSDKNSFGLQYGNPCLLVDLKPVVNRLNPNLTADNAKVHLKCDGIKNVDKENVGHIEYFPRNGVPIEFFQKERSSPPFIFLRLVRPQHGIAISIKCNVFWESRKEMVITEQGFEFEILIDM